jgi:nicotinate-nucleotide adenylyltransferase
MKIALLGGSFNPPHLGHLALADEVLFALGYDKIIFVPARQRPLKTMARGASDKDRLAMTRAAIADNAAFEADSCEMERQSPSYTYDTITHLEKKYAPSLDGKIGLIIGDDLLESFSQWFKYREIPQKADIILARRNGTAVSLLPAIDFDVIPLNNPLLQISSTDIRVRIARGLSWQYLAGKNVSEYIKAEKLYGCGNF